MKDRKRGVFAPKVLIPLLAAGAVAIGAVGVMSLLARRGEAAISMIPADAFMALSFDNTPSAGQVPLFNEIKAAMNDSGMNDFVDEFLHGLDPRTNAFKNLRSHIKGSFAVGLWGDMKSEPNVMFAVTLNDPAGAEKIVSAFAKPKTEGGITYYSPDNGEMILTFHGDYAILANNVATAQKALSVANGNEPNLYEEASFKQARQKLPDDASLMVFVNGSAIAKADEETKKMYEAIGVHPEGWMACGFTLRREGILVDTFEPAGLKGAFREALLSVKPLSYSALDRYPAGAVGVAGLSSPAAYVKLVKDIVSGIPEAKEDVNKGIAEMEKETGTSLDKDWLPALRGEVYFALYPPAAGEDEPSVIISIDESNGGTATEFADQLLEKVNSGQFDESGDVVRFKEEKVGDLRVLTPSNNKNDGYLAIAEDQVMLFTSKSLLMKTATHSGSTLGQSALATFTQGQPAQFRIHLDMYALFDMLERLGQMPKDVNLRQILSSREFTLTTHYDGNSCESHAVIPINIPELIRVLGKEAKKNQGSMEWDEEPMPDMAPPRESPPELPKLPDGAAGM